MKIKVETSAKLKKNLKGTRRKGQRVVEKGTEPCILWAIDETGPKYRETEAHITLKDEELKITIPNTSTFNELIAQNVEYHYVATFVTGKMAPLCVSIEPVKQVQKNAYIEYICKQNNSESEDVNKYVKKYQLRKGIASEECINKSSTEIL